MTLVANFQKNLFILLLVISLPTVAQNQQELNDEAYNSYKKADKELNRIYQQVLTEYRSDSLFIKNLKNSQRIWITFREAELKTRYPDRPDPSDYGSCQPMCVSSYLAKLTKERIGTLKVWLEGIKEGDVCSGTIKVI